MANITNVDHIFEAVSSLGQVDTASFVKIMTAPENVGYCYSFWKDPGVPPAGSNPAAGSGTPGAGGTAYDLDNGGMWSWADVEGGGKERYLTSLNLMATHTTGRGTLWVYDRLVGVSGITLGSTGNKNCNTVALPRYTDGFGVEAWLEITTASTANTGVVTLNSYTDTDGNTGQTGASQSFGTAAFNVGSAIRLPIDTTDRGIKAVATVNVGTATTNGVANLILAKRLFTVELGAFLTRTKNATRDMSNFPRLYDGCTPWFVWYSQDANAVTLSGAARGVSR